MNRTLYVWSGGLDSTYILLSNIFNQDPFDTIYVELENNEYKTKQEINCRKEMIDIIYATNNLAWTDYYVKIPASEPVGSLTNGCQAFFWIYGIFKRLSEYDLKEYHSIQIGYVNTDGTVKEGRHHKQRDLYYAIAKLFMERKDIPDLIYPLQTVDKLYICQYMNQSILGRKLFRKVWYCEGIKDTGKPCKECVPCKRHAETLKQYKLNPTAPVEEKETLMLSEPDT